MRRPAGVMACVVGLIGGAEFALAQSPQEKVLAESLYLDGRRRLAEGDLENACAKLAESQRLDPASGTALNLADCYERQGKIASAWTSYKATLELARRAQRSDRIEIAAQKMKELEPRISKLTLTISSREPTGLSVFVDGVGLGSGGIGAPLALDAGPHRVVLTVPGGGRTDQRIELDEGEARVVELVLPVVPPPKRDDIKREEEVRPAAARSGATWVYALGGTLLGLGAGSLAVGIGTGVQALVLGGEVDRECPKRACSASGFAAYEEANTFATASNVTFAVGAGVAAAGLGFVVAGTLLGPRSVALTIRPNGNVAATLSF
jgi:hypothetical protein